MPVRSASNTHLPHFSPLSTTTTNLTTSTHASSSHAPPLPPPDQPSLLIPTDRSVAELESQAGSSSSSGISWLGQLGRVRVEREVVLSGYALYALRTWYLSRDHWSQSIVTQTGKQTEQISVYRIVADSSLSSTEAEAEIARATQRLAGETKSTLRKTEWGGLLVTTPGAFGQDAFFVPGGDLREARPYLVVNTGLRRLGCGGRAAMTLEVPIPALRRKFLEVYRLPAPPAAPALPRTNSPQSSPSKPTASRAQQSPNSPRGPSTPSVLTDPLCLMVLEVVRLIQASLALWGLFEPEAVDGLFCDETKKGIGAWRRSMGMEHEESLKIEKETSGGCIDPRTLAVLLSSVTSTYYQLATVRPDKSLKEPFTKIHRFLDQWHSYHASAGHSQFTATYLSVESIRSLTSDFHAQRSRTGTDPLKMHRAFFSGVASATSSIHANLKGGLIDDTPLRKREHHSPSHQTSPTDGPGSGNAKGLSLIVPDDEGASVASPNAITSNLEAYIHGVLKTREKDRDCIGARRIGALWSGHLAGTDWGDMGKRRFRDVVRRRKRSTSRDPYPPDEGAESSPPSASASRGGPLNGVVRRTGSVLIGGLGGLVSRKGTVYETSDSEGGPGPNTLKNSARHKPSVPVLIEPDLEEVDEQLRSRASLSPSPTNLDRPLGHGASTHFQGLSIGSRGSKRPSIVTHSSAGSHLSLALHHSIPWIPEPERRQSKASAHATNELHHLQEIWEKEQEHQPNGHAEGSWRRRNTERTLAWRDANRQTAMMRTASDGAEVIIPEAGIEWEVVSPHCSGHRYGSRLRYPGFATLKRRHSLEDRRYYEGMARISTKNLRIDVELSSMVRQLKRREQDLLQKAAELKTVERSVQSATQAVRDHLSDRRHTLRRLKDDARDLTTHLQRLPDQVDTDETIHDLTNKIAYHTTGDTNSQDLKWRLVDLMDEWEVAHRGNEERRRKAEVVDIKGQGWWS